VEIVDPISSKRKANLLLVVFCE